MLNDIMNALQEGTLQDALAFEPDWRSPLVFSAFEPYSAQEARRPLRCLHMVLALRCHTSEHCGEVQRAELQTKQPLEGHDTCPSSITSGYALLGQRA